MKSDYASVNDQSGIFAGKGGYDITVGNNTDLKGAVIASEAEDSDKNRLDTGTISFSDIKNKANFKVSHISVSGGTGGPGAPVAYQNSDKASSTTKSAVEKGQLIVRNQEEQKQDINKLSRDTASANDPLKQIFDKQKELDKIETVELVKDIAQQAKSVVNKYDRIQAQNEVDKNKDKLSKAEAEKAYEKLTEKEKSQITLDEYYKGNEDYWYYAAVDTQLKTNQEKNENLGTMGGNVSKGIDTATSIVMGVITGDISGGLAGASAPWIAEQIKIHTGQKDEKGEWKTDNQAGNLIAHAILGAVVAELQGNSGLVGGASAVSGELAAPIIQKALYGDRGIKDLTEEEKQNLSALTQLAIGLTIASMGGDTGDVATGIDSSKNAVENNELSPPPIIPIGEGTIQYAETAREVAKEIYFKCGDSCTPEDYEKAYQDAGIANRFKEFTEEQRKAILYNIPIVGLIYGTSDAISEGNINNLLEAGLSQTEIGGLILMVYRNQPNKPSEEEVLSTIKKIDKKRTEQTSNNNQTSSTNENKGGSALNPKEHSSSPVTKPEVENEAGKGTNSTSSNPIINPATNKVVTEHTIVSSGKAPHTSTPNSIYEVSRADGSRSVTYYDANGRTFSREDYGQIHPHGQMGLGSDGRVVPHEHKITYNDKGFVTGRYYRKLNSNGKPTGDWIKEK